MPVFEISPLEAIGPVRLGVPRAVARQTMAAIGFPLENSHDGVDYFCESCMQFSYGPSDEVWFIGVCGNPNFTFVFKGIDVFARSATEVFSLMAASDNSGPHDFTSYEYWFPNQVLSLWDADEQYDRQEGESREVWGQIGIGNSAYMAAIRAIKKKA
ncbi:hypothetical protein LOY28_17670 [Pseudomonas sp. B21-017]|jgi:hypothetical protein|uniref:hypothetical protein n=1 Tax=Pseudomonas TaxID=286 RepID=UPI000380B67F|nr:MULTISPECIES: hypothetical protein [Pseudomonas]UVM36371.1 hypothetical protein LOY28_16725 [Pseudomonas sp. B21-017]UVM36550.1 hypothetical protein LOY28_17670 [Pseudomonas sp. B21-017]